MGINSNTMCDVYNQIFNILRVLATIMSHHAKASNADQQIMMAMDSISSPAVLQKCINAILKKYNSKWGSQQYQMIQVQPFSDEKMVINPYIFFKKYLNQKQKPVSRQLKKRISKLLTNRFIQVIHKSKNQPARNKLQSLLSYYKQQLNKQDHAKSCRNLMLQLLQIIHDNGIEYDEEGVFQFSQDDIQSKHGNAAKVTKKQIKIIQQQMKFYCQVAKEYKTNPRDAVLLLNFRYDSPSSTHVNDSTKNAIQTIFESLNKNFNMHIEWDDIKLQLGGMQSKKKQQRRQKDRKRIQRLNLQKQERERSQSRSRSKRRLMKP